jgi:YesN/AraC family two-component response regulator
MEVAKKSLESSLDNVNEIMFKVGYTDTKAFRSVFKKVTGLLPVQYRNKFSEQVR